MDSLGISSTKAKINVEKANEVLRNYALRNVEFCLDEGGLLKVTEAEDEAVYPYYPQAVPLGELPRRQDYPDKEEYEDAVNYTYSDRGSAGYFALLKELSLYLKTPLTILVISADPDDHDIESLVWRIEPGLGTVEELSAWASH
jgi:hypothetical protein